MTEWQEFQASHDAMLKEIEYLNIRLDAASHAYGESHRKLADGTEIKVRAAKKIRDATIMGCGVNYDGSIKYYYNVIGGYILDGRCYTSGSIDEDKVAALNPWLPTK